MIKIKIGLILLRITILLIIAVVLEGKNQLDRSRVLYAINCGKQNDHISAGGFLYDKVNITLF